ncbi:hypothetical protein GUJ93_ZPchr0011g27742 [Zizania palustris]|uniref:Uncharacterized protein n=1 Tax=Zizania palustris TaxID=103762 RepID=A0A8J5WIZ8_ZIZPA|nr:hypothetical protein GUJ93_ZPchr0011g27742 [Zizania palustris]
MYTRLDLEAKHIDRHQASEVTMLLAQPSSSYVIVSVVAAADLAASSPEAACPRSRSWDRLTLVSSADFANPDMNTSICFIAVLALQN